MKFFKMDFGDSTKATQEVWTRQDAGLIKRTSFHISAHGRDTSVWTEDMKGEELLRDVLNEFHISHSEDDKQQVVTFLDDIFGVKEGCDRT